MDYKPILSMLTSFLTNFAVAGLAVSAFQGIWYGAVVALFSFLGALVTSSYLGGYEK
jgi:hypothetical protein